jgi:hypothetical protein
LGHIGGGLKVLVLSFDDLILMTRAPGWTQDLMSLSTPAVSRVEFGDGGLVASTILSVPTRTVP